MSQDALGQLKHLKTARARWPFPDVPLLAIFQHPLLVLAWFLLILSWVFLILVEAFLILVEVLLLLVEALLVPAWILLIQAQVLPIPALILAWVKLNPLSKAAAVDHPLRAIATRT